MPSANLSEEVHASYYYLNHSYADIKAGTTYKLTVKGSSTARNVTWSSSNKKIATVSKGKVKALKPGTVYIYAKVGSQKLSCKIYVHVNNAIAQKNVKVTAYRTDNEIIAIVKNNNSYPVSYKGQAVLYDAGGAMLDTSSAYNNYLGAGRECAVKFYVSSGTSYDSFKITNTLSDVSTSLTICSGKIAVIQDNVGSNNHVMAEIKNTLNKSISYAELGIIYYDESGIPIGYDSELVSAMEANSSSIVEFSLPYDYNLHSYMTPASHKIFVNYAYRR